MLLSLLGSSVDRYYFPAATELPLLGGKDLDGALIIG